MYIKLTLITSLTATVFGAAGTPIWYGFGSLGLSEKDYVQIGQYSAVALVVSAYLLLPLIFASIVPSKLIKSNILFTVLAISGAMLPMLGISFFSYEFPSLIGGIVGLGITAILIQFKVGLKSIDPAESFHSSGRHPLEIVPLSERSCVHSSRTSERSNNDDSNVGGEVLDEIVEDEEHVPLNRDSATVSNDESDSNYSLMSDGMNNKTSQTTNIFDSTSIETATDSQRAIEMAIGPRKEGLAYYKEFVSRELSLLFLVHLDVHKLTLIASLQAQRARVQAGSSVDSGSCYM